MRRRSYPLFILSTALMFLSISGCQLPSASAPTQADSPTPPLDLIATQQALAATQTALVPVPTATFTLLPPTEVPTQVPTEATPQLPYETVHVSFDKVQFDLPKFMASGISGNIVPESVGESDFPGESYPEYINIQFNDYLLSDTFHTAQISIYPVQSYEEVGEYVSYNIQLLADLVQRRPESFQCNEDMPFLPLWNAAQLFSAQAQFVDFQSGSGLRYLTQYGQAYAPIDNTNIFYTFQGLTADQKYYISAIFPIKSASLPDQAEMPEDYEQFNEQIDTYLQGICDTLNRDAPESFIPGLNVLDTMLASLQITP